MHKREELIIVEPTTEASFNESVATWTFDDDTGYEYNPTYVEFVGSSLKLVDLGGSTYYTGDQIVITPPIIPSTILKWIRAIWLDEEAANAYIRVEVQFTNDGSSRWGINSPDFNDGEWVSYSKFVFDNIDIKQNGNEGLRFRLTLHSDGLTTPEMTVLEATYLTYSDEPIGSAYTPIFTTKKRIADYSLGTIKIHQITDSILESAEVWVKSELRRIGIDYTDLTTDPTTAKLLEFASIYRTICETGQFGIGTGVAGPISSISMGDVSKSYASVSGIQKGAKSPLDFCEQAYDTMNTLVGIFRAGDAGTAKKMSIGIARDNELLDVQGNVNAFDHRRRWQ